MALWAQTLFPFRGPILHCGSTLVSKVEVLDLIVKSMVIIVWRSDAIWLNPLWVHNYFLVWPQWWSLADVSQQKVDFSKKICKMKIVFWFDFHKYQGPSKIEHHFWRQSLITWWHFLVSYICVIWVLPLHFTSIKKIMESSVIFLRNGVLILNWKENKEAGAICFEIRIPRKKNKELLWKVPSKIYGE